MCRKIDVIKNLKKFLNFGWNYTRPRPMVSSSFCRPPPPTHARASGHGAARTTHHTS